MPAFKTSGRFRSSVKKKLIYSRIKSKERTKRIFPYLLLLLLLLTGAVVVGHSSSQPFLEALTQKVFSRIRHRTEAKGIQTTGMKFKNVHWEFPDRVFWEKVSFGVYSASRGPFLRGVHGIFRAREIEAEFHKLIRGEIRVTVRGGSFAAVSDPDPENRFEFFADRCQLSLRVPWRPIHLLRARLGRIFSEAYRILKDGKTSVPIQLSGRIRFRILGKQEDGRIETVREGAEYRLVMDPNDLKRIAGSYKEKVSDLEIGVLARYPLRAPKALRITDEAREISQKAFKKDPDVPEDAFRHVWWSYHLTKAFGPEFSMELTDAHELGEPTSAEVDRTEADHVMDYKNNQIGSDYALQGYSEGSLLERTMKDPDVLRSPAEINEVEPEVAAQKQEIQPSAQTDGLGERELFEKIREAMAANDQTKAEKLRAQLKSVHQANIAAREKIFREVSLGRKTVRFGRVDGYNDMRVDTREKKVAGKTGPVKSA